MKKETPRRCSCINSICETFELNTLFVQFTNHINKLFYATTQAIELPDNQCVAFTEHFQCTGEPWTFNSYTADFIFIDFFRTRPWSEPQFVNQGSDLV
ncbi:Uncharacterised protein [Klebsiella pneumoniae]|uniref:Uncharacterized protein n=1 Tax=Klebsiella pneumoniae TaxID=573 RepID=A0A377X8P7_KLEPN|nr:Uncharacterised protein [Klebsiella pneumoniae]